MDFSEGELIRRIMSFQFDLESDIQTNKRAAVLIPFAKVQQEWHLIFIRRAEVLGDVHSGQVAFPGGTVEAIDDAISDTALRETEEEIGVVQKDVRLLGRLSDFYSISNILVTPMIGIVDWPYQFSLQTSEVSRVFTIPLRWLADQNNYQVKLREIPQKNVPVEVIYYEEYDGEVLWGLTARIVQSLLEKII